MCDLNLFGIIFSEFIEGVSQFSVRGDTGSKMKCMLLADIESIIDSIMFLFVSVAFKIYDIDQDGFISNGELFQVCVNTSSLICSSIENCFELVL